MIQTWSRKDRIDALLHALHARVLVVDGAMGTAIQERDLGPEDFGGAALEGCNENLVLTRPDVITDIHEGYLRAGADIVETNTFGATPLVLAEYDLQAKAHLVNVRATELALQAALRHSTPERPRFVAGSIGPTTKAISVTGGVTFEELIENFHAQARGLHEGGADYYLIETCQDTRNIKAALLGIERLNREGYLPLPVAVSGTIEPMGTMLAGQSVESLCTSLEHVDLLYIGLNCATGPTFMTDHIRTLAEMARTRVSCVPNAGLPDENGQYLETPEMLARVLEGFGQEGWLNVVGGCCGTRDGHIAALARAAAQMSPRTPKTTRRSTLSGVDYVEMTAEGRPHLVGERTNVIGSRKFKELIVAEKFEDAAEVARAQVKGAAAILEVLVRKIRVPLMIDSTDAKVIEVALTYSQGKAIINSVNLEDGEERFEEVVPLARRFGAALVVGCIDEDKTQGMAVTRARKLEVAQRCHQLLTEKYGMAEEDLYFDPLVFPCATGDVNYVGSALETIEGVRLIKEHLPRCKTVLGISNVSFGLPAAGREVLNSVFLYHCVQAGLDLALVNSEKLERYPSIPDVERTLAEDLVFWRGADPVAAFAAHFRDLKKAPQKRKDDLPLDERLARYIVEGSRDGLEADLKTKLAEGAKPLDVINGPLMTGMDEVGRLFNTNQLIVAEVLQSAEAMKAAVGFLEPFMDKLSTASRGKVLLATVKGDVHDIGKNLVEIILGNNGFEIINLGIKVPPADLIAAVREHKPDVVGLSGLLVKSAQQMVVTAQDLSKAGVSVPMLVGGAALSRNFVNKQIAPAYAGTVAYANDAMNGLELARQIVDPERFQAMQTALREERERAQLANNIVVAVDAAPSSKRARTRSASVRLLPASERPRAPDFERHVLPATPLDHIWRYINPMMLYGRHLGLKGRLVHTVETAPAAELGLSEAGRKALELREAVNTVKAAARQGLLQPKAMYQFFPAASDGEDIVLFSADGARETARFTMPRQDKEPGLCLADYLAPIQEGERDALAMFVTTCGAGVREAAERWKNEGRYLECHILQALALESAEAYAELLHEHLRSAWGFPDPQSATMLDRFRANYHGKRYSFGYPACPRLEDQAILFAALRPEDMGVVLTDGCMMEPEASVSAIVFHHPGASYFTAGEEASPAESDGPSTQRTNAGARRSGAAA